MPVVVRMRVMPIHMIVGVRLRGLMLVSMVVPVIMNMSMVMSVIVAVHDSVIVGRRVIVVMLMDVSMIMVVSWFGRSGRGIFPLHACIGNPEVTTESNLSDKAVFGFLSAYSRPVQGEINGNIRMKIGELARSAGCPVETVRYYEREGLLAEPARTDKNYRIYDASQVDRLAFIRHCRSLDMTLDEIRRLLRLFDAPDGDLADADAVLDEHIGHVADRITELVSLQHQLSTLRELCRQAVAKGGGVDTLQALTAAVDTDWCAPTGEHRHGSLGRTHR